MAVDFAIPFTEFGGQGAVIHFAHANGYLPGCYRQMIAPLTKSYRVLSMHARPVWSNQPPESLTNWSQMADDLITFLDAHELKGIVGIGHSMGGVATMYAAQARPELFRALILIEPVFLPEQLLALISENPTLGEQNPLYKITRKRRYQWDSLNQAFEHFRSKRIFSRLSDSTLHDYVDNVLYLAESGQFELKFTREWEAQIYRIPPADVWQRIALTTQSTLGIRGADTDTITEASWQKWQSLQPSATFVQVPDTTHLLTMEKPEHLAQIITDFLDQLSY